MKALEYKKYYTKTGQLTADMVMMCHKTILDLDGDSVHKLFKDKKTVLEDAKVYGYVNSSTTKAPVAAALSNAAAVQVEEGIEINEVTQKPVRRKKRSI